MADYVYHDYADLAALGERIIQKAVEVTAWQGESYAQAEQDSDKDFAKSLNRKPTANPHYTAPTEGKPHDHVPSHSEAARVHR